MLSKYGRCRGDSGGGGQGRIQDFGKGVGVWVTVEY